MSKLASMREAVQDLVHDGNSVYLAGFTHLIPFAAGQEIIRQGRRNLELCRATPDLIYDQMVFAGCARKIVFSWAGNPGVGLLRGVRQALESGQLEWEEYTHFSMVARLQAGAMKLPYFPVRLQASSDLPAANPNIRVVTCPFTGEELHAVPALRPDVAVIHVQKADAEGNAQIWGILGEQREVAFAAKRLIITAEEIVDGDEIRSDPNRTVVPDFRVDAVVLAPWGAHPSYAQGYYDRDNEFYRAWDDISRTPESVAAWLDEWVYGVVDRNKYRERLSRQKLAELTPGPRFSTPVNYGVYR